MTCSASAIEVARGITLEQSPHSIPAYGISHAVVRDPSGYHIEIQRLDDPRWSEPAG